MYDARDRRTRTGFLGSVGGDEPASGLADSAFSVEELVVELARPTVSPPREDMDELSALAVKTEVAKVDMGEDCGGGSE
jgi:hypothetical protein